MAKNVLITLNKLQQMQLKLRKKKSFKKKKVEATGDLIRNIIGNKITKFRKTHNKIFKGQMNMTKKYLKKYMYLKKKGKKLLMN